MGQTEEEVPAEEVEEEGSEVGGKTGEYGVQKPREGLVLRRRRYAVHCVEVIKGRAETWAVVRERENLEGHARYRFRVVVQVEAWME